MCSSVAALLAAVLLLAGCTTTSPQKTRAVPACAARYVGTAVDIAANIASVFVWFALLAALPLTVALDNVENDCPPPDRPLVENRSLPSGCQRLDQETLKLVPCEGTAQGTGEQANDPPRLRRGPP
jgi:hypothetical protein